MQCKHHFYLEIHVIWIEPDIILTLSRTFHSKGVPGLFLERPNSHVVLPVSAVHRLLCSRCVVASSISC